MNIITEREREREGETRPLERIIIIANAIVSRWYFDALIKKKKKKKKHAILPPEMVPAFAARRTANIYVYTYEVNACTEKGVQWTVLQGALAINVSGEKSRVAAESSLVET